MVKKLLIIILVLSFMLSSGYTQITDSLVIASEVLFNGSPLTDFEYFKPGRILDNGNTIWFCGYRDAMFVGRESYVFRSTDGGNTFTHNATAISPPARVAQMDAFDADIGIHAKRFLLCAGFVGQELAVRPVRRY